MEYKRKDESRVLPRVLTLASEGHRRSKFQRNVRNSVWDM